jgi:integrase
MGKGNDEKKRGPIRDANGVYHYRRRIPDDIRAILREMDSFPNALGARQDKREEKKRLGRDSVKAQAAWVQYNRQVEAKWDRLRVGPLPGLTVVQREALAGDVYRRWLKAYPDDDRSAWSNAFRDLALVREWDEEFPDDDLKMLDMMQRLGVDDVLAERGLVLPPSARWPLVDAANQAAQHACRYAMQRLKGDLRPDPEAERYPPWPDPKTTTLAGLHEKWVKNRRPNPETQRAFRSAIDKLVAFVGFDDVTRLATADIRRWCASMKERGDIGGIRIRDGYLAAVKAVLNSAVTMGYVERNVAALVKVDIESDRQEEKREKDLRDAEIYAILRATSGPFNDDPCEDVRNARRWVAWLLLYSGARVSEICRLESRHIIREEGVDAINIETSKSGRPRKVPLHQDLKDQGFLEFVASRRGRPLFFSKSKLADDRRLTIHRTRAEGLAEWIRSLEGMEDLRVAPNHGFRHRWKTESRRLFMDIEVRHYLQGHAVETVGEGYGHVPLDITVPWMNMFPTFDVSGQELVVHRGFDVSALKDVAARMRAADGSAAVSDDPTVAAA